MPAGLHDDHQTDVGKHTDGQSAVACFSSDSNTCRAGTPFLESHIPFIQSYTPFLSSFFPFRPLSSGARRRTWHEPSVTNPFFDSILFTHEPSQMPPSTRNPSSTTSIPPLSPSDLQTSLSSDVQQPNDAASTSLL
ncbi:hypothetical protein K505DRAFT_46182 [Melanomma pulvis-pyrius CBS 109.77]|uniref:Uncharacterized protein n=1 Tax=Melanomma pulvis-pyrius CBS 109.77 TaxID=1314802 RepID=A0A6A6X9H5_9PLEO|nr:hypothetical protein K505DRAFT_46182 [Melanomma pulvis-pyrius CBS 109.77]